MTHLKELLLNNNTLRVLPFELGKLFMLEVSEVLYISKTVMHP